MATKVSYVFGMLGSIIRFYGGLQWRMKLLGWLPLLFWHVGEFSNFDVGKFASRKNISNHVTNRQGCNFEDLKS